MHDLLILNFWEWGCYF